MSISSYWEKLLSSSTSKGRVELLCSLEPRRSLVHCLVVTLCVLFLPLSCKIQERNPLRSQLRVEGCKTWSPPLVSKESVRYPPKFGPWSLIPPGVSANPRSFPSVFHWLVSEESLRCPLKLDSLQGFSTVYLWSWSSVHLYSVLFFTSIYSTGSIILNSLILASCKLAHQRLFVSSGDVRSTDLPFYGPKWAISVHYCWFASRWKPIHPLHLPPSILPSIRVFFQWVSFLHQVAKVLEIQLQQESFQWIFRISFRMGWLDLLAVQRTLKSLLQHHSSKASILCRSALFIVQLSHPYMTTGKIIALNRWTFVGRVMSLLFFFF